MPELPDLAVYIHALTALVAGRQLIDVRLLSPFVLRTVDPPIESVKGRTVHGIFRIGKRIVLSWPPPQPQVSPRRLPASKATCCFSSYT